MTIRLLGPPMIERDGEPPRPPRGRKSWALLAYLLLAERPPSRRHLAELLFADADDPLGALRWTLAELRRVLGQSDVLTGDPVMTAFGEQVAVDVHRATGEYADPRPLLEVGERAARRAAGALESRRSSHGCWSSGTGSRRWSRPGCGRRRSGCWPRAGDRGGPVRRPGRGPQPAG